MVPKWPKSIRVRNTRCFHKELKHEGNFTDFFDHAQSFKEEIEIPGKKGGK